MFSIALLTLFNIIIIINIYILVKKEIRTSLLFLLEWYLEENLPTFELVYAHCIKILQLRCNTVNQPQGTSYAGCVSGTKVANYGAPYDFNSIMHYGVFS
jgi:hypothetical protein